MKIVLTLLAVSSVAFGAKVVDLKSLDKDADGFVSVKEATEHAALFNSFKKLDTNKDGKLDNAEIAKFSPKKKAEKAAKENVKS